MRRRLRVLASPRLDQSEAYTELFKELDRNVAAATRATEESTGLSSPCKAGCGACCRQLFTVELADAILLLRAVRAMPLSMKQSIRTAVSRWSKAVSRAGIDPRFELDAEDKNETYFEKNIPCPLLVHEACSAYSARPLACRVLAVVGSPEPCRGGAGRAEPVDTTACTDAFTEHAVTLSARLPVLNPIGLWLDAGWPLVMQEDEPDYEAWAQGIIAGGRLRSLAIDRSPIRP